MRKIRITHPVVGLMLTAMIGAGCLAAAKSQPTTQSSLICPGQSVGLVKLGMTEDEVRNVIGSPTTRPWGQAKARREYQELGMTILFSEESAPKVAGILGGQPQNSIGSLFVQPFNFRTTEDLGIGSTTAQIEHAYGKPDFDQKPDPNIDWRLLTYSHRGIQFALTDQQVVWISVCHAVD